MTVGRKKRRKRKRKKKKKRESTRETGEHSCVYRYSPSLSLSFSVCDALGHLKILPERRLASDKAFCFVFQQSPRNFFFLFFIIYPVYSARLPAEENGLRQLLTSLSGCRSTQYLL